jgi:hypothetical protein
VPTCSDLGRKCCRQRSGCAKALSSWKELELRALQRREGKKWGRKTGGKKKKKTHGAEHSSKVIPQ